MKSGVDVEGLKAFELDSSGYFSAPSTSVLNLIDKLYRWRTYHQR